MENKFKISLILPVYNASEYLRDCMDSLIGQTYANIEFLCINDGSTDNSISILNEYAQKDERIKVFDLTNHGVSYVRNFGIEKADGDYIMFADADDWFELNSCERLIDVAQKYDPDVVMFSYYREYGNKTLERNNIFPQDLVVFNEEECHQLWRRFAGLIGEELRYPENFESNNPLWSKLYRADIFKKNKDVRYVDNKTIKSGGDGLLNLAYFKYVRKAVFIADHLYHYRKTNDHSIVTTYKKDFVDKRFHLYELYNDYIHKHDLGEDFKRGISNRIAASIIGIGIHELSAPTNFVSKAKSIKRVLSRDVYSNSIQELELQYMPYHWRLFFSLCKSKHAFSVLCLLKVISILRKFK